MVLGTSFSFGCFFFFCSVLYSTIYTFLSLSFSSLPAWRQSFVCTWPSPLQVFYFHSNTRWLFQWCFSRSASVCLVRRALHSQSHFVGNFFFFQNFTLVLNPASFLAVLFKLWRAVSSLTNGFCLKVVEEQPQASFLYFTIHTHTRPRKFSSLDDKKSVFSFCYFRIKQNWCLFSLWLDFARRL